jgi:hypothetical protein
LNACIKTKANQAINNYTRRGKRTAKGQSVFGEEKPKQPELCKSLSGRLGNAVHKTEILRLLQVDDNNDINRLEQNQIGQQRVLDEESR